MLGPLLQVMKPEGADDEANCILRFSDIRKALNSNDFLAITPRVSASSFRVRL